MPLPITFKSPLPPDELWLETLNVSAGLSTLGEMQLGLLGTNADISPDQLLGKPVSISIELADGDQRPLNGFVTRFGSAVHRGGRHVGYQAIVRPWLWVLTRTSNCRIFQEMTVPDIVKKVFGTHRVANAEWRLFRHYRTWTYCVQYRESDFNFIARLLELEGIYWYFEHKDDKHTLVLVDSLTAHDPVPGYERLPYYAHVNQVPPDTEYMASWRFSHEIRSGQAMMTSYDFERPSTDLSVHAAQQNSHDLADYEVFDFQGDYAERGDAEQWVEDRMEELQTGQRLMHGSTNAHGLEVGRLFTLEQHPREDQNAQFLVTQLTIAAHIEASESKDDPGYFHCDVQAIPATQQFRPPRVTLKPSVNGPQTAQVVGPAGEEIHTDTHGRVKLQFHWDRYGRRDENSSCWIRVSHPWAGKGWGAVSIPRIGQEVVVDFLEGDPDQPIVTGRVYNGEQNAPFPLPAGAVVSGIKSNTHKGAGFNEMSMNDTAGKELINIHAQYDMTTKVEHDDTQTVVNNRKIDVDGTHTETIKGNTTIKVSQGKLDHDVAIGTANYHVMAALTEKYDDTQTTTVKNALAINSTAGPISVSSDSQHVYINAATSIQLHVGASTIWMDAGGQIAIKGVNVSVEGSSTVTIKGGIVHSEAQSEHQTKGAIVLSDGSATNTVKGGMVMLNP